MSFLGVCMMVVSNGIVLVLTVYCFYKVLTTPSIAQQEHGILDIDTRDSDPPAAT